MATAKRTTGYLVWRLSMKWRVAVDRALAPLGITHAQYSLLASLFGMEYRGIQPSQRELADYSGLEPMYVSKLVRGLEAADIVERTTHPDDPRAVQLALTKHGKSLVERAVAIVADLTEDLTAPLGGTRSKKTRDLVAALETLLDAP